MCKVTIFLMNKEQRTMNNEFCLQELKYLRNFVENFEGKSSKVILNLYF